MTPSTPIEDTLGSVGALSPSGPVVRRESGIISASVRPRPPTSRRSGGPGPVAPRLLDLEDAARYLAVSSWTARDLLAAGTLRRVRIPLPNGGELRKLLFDRADLDALIARWKDGPET